MKKKKKTPDFIVWNRLKVLRHSRELTQIEVAAGAGISLTTLWYLEQGFDKKATQETKEKLAKFFDVKMSDIFPVEVTGNL